MKLSCEFESMYLKVSPDDGTCTVEIETVMSRTSVVSVDNGEK